MRADQGVPIVACGPDRSAVIYDRPLVDRVVINDRTLLDGLN